MNPVYEIPRMRCAEQLQGLHDLCRWANSLGNTKSAFEIGSYAGEGSEVLAKYFNHLTCVDPWSDICVEEERSSYPFPMKAVKVEFDKRMKPYNVTKWQITSRDAVGCVARESLDFVYIDGSHKFEDVWFDLINWGLKIRPGGVLSGHDLNHPSVRDALIESGLNRVRLFPGWSWGIQL